MGWSVEVHERQKLAEAAAARRPRRSQPAAPRPVETGVWHVSAGAKTVTVLAAAVLAGLWARRSNSRQQRLASSAQHKGLLGRLGDAVATRLQALGIPDWLDKARGRGASGSQGSRKHQKQRPKPAARAAGDAALQRSARGAASQGLESGTAFPSQQQRQQDATAAAKSSDRAAADAQRRSGTAAAPEAPPSAAQPETQSSGGSVSNGAASPQQDAKFLDAAPEPAAAQPPVSAQPVQQRGGQRKKKGKGKKKK